MDQVNHRLRIGIPIPPEDSYANYFNALKELGAEGVKAPADVDPSEYDGLLLPGGGDVDPSRYGQENTASGDIDPALDALQFAALDRFVKAGKPVFGICRGHQLLNVYFGGTLIQHLPNHRRHDWEEGSSADKAHLTAAEPDSWIGQIYGASFTTNSAHHQAVDRPGEGLTVDQRSDDGVVEAMHHSALPVWSVQWHPERMCFAHRREDTVDGGAVIEWFLRQCRG